MKGWSSNYLHKTRYLLITEDIKTIIFNEIFVKILTMRYTKCIIKRENKYKWDQNKCVFQQKKFYYMKLIN